jgi:copper transport protein
LRSVLRGLTPAVVGLLALPPVAHGHAELEGTSPGAGAVLQRAPALVVLHFGEPVEGKFGAVRVLDGAGRRADDGNMVRPAGRRTDLGVGLKPDLPKGSYTAAYRVVSLDGHVVSGSFTFRVGRRSGSAAAGPVRSMPNAPHAGPVTEAAFGVARGANYLATALVVGLLAFLPAAWLPALDSVGAGGPSWVNASETFSRRAGWLLWGGITIGIVAGLAGIVLEGADAAGTSFWSALRGNAVHEVTKTRFGAYWSFRVVDWCTLAAVVALAGREAVVPQLRRAALGAGGLAIRMVSPRLLLTVGLPAAVLVLVPALAGHAFDQGPSAILLPLDVLHVLAMSVWLGGLATLLLAVVAAARGLEASDGNRLLAAAVARFSDIALLAVAMLVLSGVVQAAIHIGSLHALLHTGYGRAVVAKVALTLVLLGLGALNHEHTVPALRRLARGEEAEGSPSRLLRRAMAAEIALVVSVIAVTSALVSYMPPAAHASMHAMR